MLIHIFFSLPNVTPKKTEETALISDVVANSPQQGNIYIIGFNFFMNLNSLFFIFLILYMPLNVLAYSSEPTAFHSSTHLSTFTHVFVSGDSNLYFSYTLVPITLRALFLFLDTCEESYIILCLPQNYKTTTVDKFHSPETLLPLLYFPFHCIILVFLLFGLKTTWPSFIESIGGTNDYLLLRAHVNGILTAPKHFRLKPTENLVHVLNYFLGWSLIYNFYYLNDCD
ncbi:hypothetical protein ACJX0J_007861 [Zea mays]